MPPAAPAPMEAATAGSCRAGGGVRCFCCCCCCDRSAGRLVPEAVLLWTGSSNITRSGCSAAAGVFAGCWPGCCPENLSMELGRGGTADMLFVCDPSSLASRLGVAPRSTLQDSPWASDVCTAYAPYADVSISDVHLTFWFTDCRQAVKGVQAPGVGETHLSPLGIGAALTSASSS